MLTKSSPAVESLVAQLTPQIEAEMANNKEFIIDDMNLDPILSEGLRLEWQNVVNWSPNTIRISLDLLLAEYANMTVSQVLTEFAALLQDYKTFKGIH